MRHLLVVDDDAAVADVMRLGLEADGTCRVTIAPGATEALEAIDRDRPHAAIIDAVLPQVPGLVLARTVIDLGVPVLIVSGDPALQKGLAEAGCPFLLKPFHLSQLAAETRMLLDTATARKIEVARALDRMLAAKEELAEVTEQTRRLVEESRRFREEVAVRYRVHFLDDGDGVIDGVQLGIWNRRASDPGGAPYRHSEHRGRV